MSTLDQVEAMVESMKNERASMLETKAAQIRVLEKRIAELEGNYVGAMIDNEELVKAYRKRMPNDEWLNLNYPTNPQQKESGDE